LEAHSSLKGYSIAGGRIPILISLRKTSDLKPHEETVAEDLKRLVDALRENPVLRHPIIADRRTGIVLDGTHRLAAIKQLECNFIPSALVEYDDPQITIERWFRQFSGSNVRNLENDLKQLGPKEVSQDECEKGLSKRRLCDCREIYVLLCLRGSQSEFLGNGSRLPRYRDGCSKTWCQHRLSR